MAFLLFRERNMDTTPKEQPPQSTDGKPSLVRTSEPETQRGTEPAPPEPHQPMDEPGYGHGV
jgi:hypothetical protein